MKKATTVKKKLAKKAKKAWSANQSFDIKRLALKDSNTRNIDTFKNILLNFLTGVLGQALDTKPNPKT